MSDFLSENAAKNSLRIKDVSRHTQTDTCLILQYHRDALLCHDPRQVEEISKNKIVLEEVLGHTIEYFSYPFGNDNGFPAETVDILRDLGFSLACGNAYGTISTASQTNCYELPRVKVGNWNPFAFCRFWEGFFGQSPY